MRFQLDITCDNAAFRDHDPDNPEPETSDGREVARILRTLAGHLEDDVLSPDDGRPVLDYNGNRVGAWTVES